MCRTRAHVSLARAVVGCVAAILVVCLSGEFATCFAHSQMADPRLEKAYRFVQGGWIYVHLEGSPGEIGYQHGYLLAAEIEDAFRAVQLRDTHDTGRDWTFFRQTAREMLWPHVEAEYREELQGIAEGLKAKGVELDVDDVVALNAFEELADYYVPWLNLREHVQNPPRLVAPVIAALSLPQAV